MCFGTALSIRKMPQFILISIVDDMADALTDILDSIRMRGSIFSRAALNAPWGIESGVTGNGAFHAVVRGRAWAQLADGGPSIELERGDVVLMPFGDNHLMTDEPSRLTQPIADLTSIDRRGMGELVVEGAGSHTSLICEHSSSTRPGLIPSSRCSPA